MNIWVHGIGGKHTTILRNIPYNTECKTIYNLLSSIWKIPSHMLSLSNGVKILQRRILLCAYTSGVDLSHGLNLHCNIRMLGGGIGDHSLYYLLYFFQNINCKNEHVF